MRFLTLEYVLGKQEMKITHLIKSKNKPDLVGYFLLNLEISHYELQIKMSAYSQGIHYENRFLNDAIMRTFYGEWDQSADVPIVANYMVLNYGLHVFSIEIFIIRIAQSKFWLYLCFRSLNQVSISTAATILWYGIKYWVIMQMKVYPIIIIFFFLPLIIYVYHYMRTS